MKSKIEERYHFYQGYLEGLVFAKNSNTVYDITAKIREAQEKIDELQSLLKITQMKLEEEAVYALSAGVARQFRVIPIGFRSEGNLKILVLAMSDPRNIEVVDTVAFAAGYPVRPVLVEGKVIDEAIDRYYK